ncbi:MAG: DUF4157 domain-containing protein, partial [Proteobacteria bacterium]|nr:DUF4157 domain-containing protein [Pseudomonadota bacterium]
ESASVALRPRISRLAPGPTGSVGRDSSTGNLCFESASVALRPRNRSVVQLIPVQYEGRSTAKDGLEAQRLARLGVAGGGGGTQLPHHATIQRSFGKYNIKAVRTHSGKGTGRVLRTMRANAFTHGRHIVFSRYPTLRTAAHEATHFVQQKCGLRIRGGVGRVGDRHERHADEVADAVTRGESAEALLDKYVQRQRAIE